MNDEPSKAGHDEMERSRRRRPGRWFRKIGVRSALAGLTRLGFVALLLSVAGGIWRRPPLLWIVFFLRTRPWLTGMTAGCLVLLGLVIYLVPHRVDEEGLLVNEEGSGSLVDDVPIERFPRGSSAEEFLPSLAARMPVALPESDSAEANFDGRLPQGPFFAPGNGSDHVEPIPNIEFSPAPPEMVQATTTAAPRGAWLTGTIEELKEDSTERRTALKQGGDRSRQ